MWYVLANPGSTCVAGGEDDGIGPLRLPSVSADGDTVRCRYTRYAIEIEH